MSFIFSYYLLLSGTKRCKESWITKLPTGYPLVQYFAILLLEPWIFFYLLVPFNYSSYIFYFLASPVLHSFLYLSSIASPLVFQHLMSDRIFYFGLLMISFHSCIWNDFRGSHIFTSLV